MKYFSLFFPKEYFRTGWSTDTGKWEKGGAFSPTQSCIRFLSGPSSIIHQFLKNFCPSKTNLNIFFLFWNIRSVQFLGIRRIKNLQYNMFDFPINNFTVWNQSFLLYLVLFVLMCCDFPASCCRSCCGISYTAILLLTSNWQKLFS